MKKQELIDQLNKWIKDAEDKAVVYNKHGAFVAEASATSMKIAYKQVLTFVMGENK